MDDLAHSRLAGWISAAAQDLPGYASALQASLLPHDLRVHHTDRSLDRLAGGPHAGGTPDEQFARARIAAQDLLLL